MASSYGMRPWIATLHEILHWEEKVREEEGREGERGRGEGRRGGEREKEVTGSENAWNRETSN